MEMKFDNLDLKILNIVSKNARVPVKEIAERCEVSRAAVHQHLARMRAEKMIADTGFRVNPRDLGYGICTFVGIRLEKASYYKQVVPQIEVIPEVVECHYTTGSYALLIKLYATDNVHLMEILSDRIQSIKGVSSTEAMVSLEEGFLRNLPIPEVTNMPSRRKKTK